MLCVTISSREAGYSTRNQTRRRSKKRQERNPGQDIQNKGKKTVRDTRPAREPVRYRKDPEQRKDKRGDLRQRKDRT
jgi:hypothetical protein